MSRKEKLFNRAYTYAGARQQAVRDGEQSLRGALMDCYEAGYKAAMRDARKVVKACATDNVWHPVHEPVKRLNHINHCVRVRITQWLRPLR